MCIPGNALGAVLTEVESSYCVKCTHCCSVFIGIIEALGNKYSLVYAKRHLELNLSSNTPFVIKW